MTLAKTFHATNIMYDFEKATYRPIMKKSATIRFQRYTVVFFQWDYFLAYFVDTVEDTMSSIEQLYCTIQ